MTERDMTKGEKAVTVTAMVGTAAFFLVWVLPVVLAMIFLGVVFFASL
jgi:hypothetical protein